MNEWYASKEIVNFRELKLVGYKVRTCNKDEFDHAKAKIAPLIGRYWSEGIYNKIPNRKVPFTSFATYTNYESNEFGEYDYLFGEEVTDFTPFCDGLSGITIPSGKYLKITTNPGPMPLVVVSAWQNIWKMTTEDFGGERVYGGEFEVYDTRAVNPLNSVIDIYLGIK